jgi:anti-sigma B factor antagonist
MPLQVDVLKIGSIAIVSVVGDLDAYTSPRLRRTLTEIGKRGPYRVEVRMQAVDHVDSFGAGALLAGIRAIEAGGGSVSTVVNAHVGRYLEMVGLGPPLHLTADTVVLGAAG